MDISDDYSKTAVEIHLPDMVCTGFCGSKYSNGNRTDDQACREDK